MVSNELNSQEKVRIILNLDHRTVLKTSLILV